MARAVRRPADEARHLLFIVSLLLHAWVGMRDILMDYARPMSVRLALEVLVAVLLVAWGGWAVQILWSV